MFYAARDNAIIDSVLAFQFHVVARVLSIVQIGDTTSSQVLGLSVRVRVGTQTFRLEALWYVCLRVHVWFL
jgi:hypothetical protein